MENLKGSIQNSFFQTLSPAPCTQMIVICHQGTTPPPGWRAQLQAVRILLVDPIPSLLRTAGFSQALCPSAGAQDMRVCCPEPGPGWPPRCSLSPPASSADACYICPSSPVCVHTLSYWADMCLMTPPPFPPYYPPQGLPLAGAPPTAS